MMDGVMDQLEGWFDPEHESGEHRLEQLRAVDAVAGADLAAGGLRAATGSVSITALWLGGEEAEPRT
jgi:hypothetical protein